MTERQSAASLKQLRSCPDFDNRACLPERACLTFDYQSCAEHSVQCSALPTSHRNAEFTPDQRKWPLQVLVRDNNIDQALRVLKKKMQREGVFREMKQRRFYEKPSERTTREKAEAIRRSRKLAASRRSGKGSLQREESGKACELGGETCTRGRLAIKHLAE